MEERNDNLSLTPSTSLDEAQPTVTGASLTSATVKRTETSLHIFRALQQQHVQPTPVTSVSGISSQFGNEDQSRFPVVSNDKIAEINESAASKKTKRTTKTWLTVWPQCCIARNINDKMGFRGRQDHYSAYVEDFAISQRADGNEVVFLFFIIIYYY